MAKRLRFFFLVGFIALLLLVACSGGSGGESTGTTGTDSTTGDPLASGPVLLKQSREGPAARGATSITSDAAAVCLSPAEAELARRINEYRMSLGLPAIMVSKSLTLVAQQHVWDSNNNSNAWPPAPAGQECNMHSWSGNVNPALNEGTWTGVCYTDDHANAAGMWSKPRELAGYPSDGYENSHWASNGTTPAGALNGWQNSPGHNAVITEQNGWGPFLALGVGIAGNYAHMWVGTVTDPAGEAPLCGGGNVEQPAPTAVPPTDVPAATEPAAEATEAPAPEATTAPTEPTTAAPTTGEVLNQTGTVAGSGVTHTFNTAQGQTYSVVVTPSAEFDALLEFECSTPNSGRSGTVDSQWEGGAERFNYIAPGNGSCTVTVAGYEGSTGPYTIVVTAR